jgi:hypothetical protein
MTSRLNIGVRRATHTASCINEDEMMMLKTEFTSATRNLFTDFDIDLNNVYNMDQTAIFFDPKNETTLEYKGTKEFRVNHNQAQL